MQRLRRKLVDTKDGGYSTKTDMCRRQNEQKISRKSQPTGQREGKSALKAKNSKLKAGSRTRFSMSLGILQTDTIGTFIHALGSS